MAAWLGSWGTVYSICYLKHNEAPKLSIAHPIMKYEVLPSSINGKLVNVYEFIPPVYLMSYWADIISLPSWSYSKSVVTPNKYSREYGDLIPLITAR